jgi:hypothetical protein
MKHDVFTPDALFAHPESVTRPGRMEVQRAIQVVPFADQAPFDRRTVHPDETELLRRIRAIVRAD